MKWMTHNYLIGLINKMHPNAIHGKDFWVAHPIDPVTNAQGGQAYIVDWRLDTPAPADAEIAALDQKYGAEVAKEWLAFETRFKIDELLKEADRLFKIGEDDDDEDTIKRIKAYRRALRALPEQTGWPDNLVWPEIQGAINK